MKRLSAFLIFITLISLVITPGVWAKNAVIGCSFDELENVFWHAAFKGMQDAAAKYDLKLVVKTCDGDAVKQNKQIDELIAMGVDAIVVVYVDRKAILQGVKAANKAKVPIVYCDRDIDAVGNVKPDWGVGTNEYALNRAGWKYIAEYARKKNMKLKVLEIVGSLNDKNVLVRSEVTKEAAEKYPEIELVNRVLTEWDAEVHLSGTLNALQANPEINCIYMHYDGFLDPIASALKQAGRWKKIGQPGHVVLMPYSGAGPGIKAVIDGYAELCMGMNIIGEGFASVEAAYKLSKGEDPGPFKMDPGFIVTPENLATMGPQTYGWSDANK
jgi:ABC-type sugar transport system substrate-binding protein